MLVKATPFLRLHGLDDAAVTRAMEALGLESVTTLELAVAADLLREAGYEVQVRREESHAG